MPLIHEKSRDGPPLVSRLRINGAAEIAQLQRAMNEDVGPLRTRAGLERALSHITDLSETCAELPEPRRGLDPEWIDLCDLRNMRLVAECVTRAALARTESRGAHQREDFPQTENHWQRHQKLRLAAGGVQLEG
jgi:succinate dehydrogenase/fumarate reductase flavoprotein subunit